jgi:hypothetical protein
MKIIHLLFLIISLTCFLDGVAQKAVSHYINLQEPVSNVFFNAYASPTAAPNITVSNTKFDSSDLVVDKGASVESVYHSHNGNNGYFFNTWNHSKKVSITARFTRIKHVHLKDESWSKIEDELYYVVEALRADSVIITIKKSKTDSSGSTKLLQDIIGLFAGGETIFGKVLNVINSSTNNTTPSNTTTTSKTVTPSKSDSSSTSKAISKVDSISKSDSTTKLDSTKKGLESSIVRIINKGEDSIQIGIFDSTVYYAVRYAQIHNPEEQRALILGIFKGKSIAAPACAPDELKDTVPHQLFAKGDFNMLLPEISNACILPSEKVAMHFKYDGPIGQVIITRQKLPSTLSNNNNREKTEIETVSDSVLIDFSSDNQRNQPYSDTYRYVANRVPINGGVQNILVVCDFEILFDTDTRILKVVNKNVQYKTCIYYQTADLKFFPN